MVGALCQVRHFVKLFNDEWPVYLPSLTIGLLTQSDQPTPTASGSDSDRIRPLQTSLYISGRIRLCERGTLHSPLC